MALLISALVGASELSACGDDSRQGDDTTVDTTVASDETGELDASSTVVEYHFGDSSVPPEHHRSYTLTVRQGKARLVVDSYGDVLHDVSQPIGPAMWTALLDEAAALESFSPEEEQGCTGGTSRSLEVDEGDSGTPVVSIDIALCDGANEAEAAALESMMKPVLDEFDMTTLLAENDD